MLHSILLSVHRKPDLLRVCVRVCVSVLTSKWMCVCVFMLARVDVRACT